MNFLKKKVFLEVFSKEDFMTLKLIDVHDPRFRKRLRFLYQTAEIHRSLNWNNQFPLYAQELIDIETSVDNILSSGICSSGGRILSNWGNLLQNLLPKIQQAIQDCQNNSWNWLNIKF